MRRNALAVEHLEQRYAHDRPLERLDSLHVPAMGVAVDQSVELSLARDRGARELLGERQIVALELFVQRPPRDVMAVDGEDGCAALVRRRI